ncbi:MurR/RpiR family transcriptional regulator [Defluviitalea raffinosedens]|jgi:DNA-binding MurR/RpiR family transcriptional regulator|uniref:SIS domain-containing protein n=1 Tax=Defluviitalea raffinosedens TaxID=1450156 RepID=A0A7C8LCE5_9FIRM|nr:MurR/RpiR family transcriptional regulator [Defluviitalea raffinosedens]KAE9631203.1 SIS domain-containing protein [Defluviitalea raffinosedens]MBM7686269.1 DNA-binding MurR/RpiR family transcriptional regulator [Defluviitalea raffinosedens]MBZ4667102.1 MurR/RpiR family transcriptional regulator [Defluviitaleaceae bacterium]HHW68610.1 MurR/RpiR family transcriptional regulator [Candidatus Epulonipiscium sp.]
MKRDFITNIKSSYNQFTKAEKKVADFILTNPKEVLFMSITDLAEACEVGDTTVFRFCKTMDLKGYQEFKMVLSLSLNDGQEEMNTYTGNNISINDSFAEVAKKVLNTNINALTETYSLIKEEDVDKAINMLHEARMIYFFGVGASMLTAMKAMNKFLRIENKVFCIQDSHMQSMMAATMTSDDVAVLFSYSGATKDTIHVAQLAKKAGAKTICITRFIKSPLSSYADLTLLSGANEGPLQGGSTSAEISQLFLIDLLYTEYYRRYFEHCSANNEKTSASVLEKLC